MKMLFIGSCLIILLSIPFLSFSQKWVLVGTDSQGTQVYVRTPYVSKSMEGIKVWVKNIVPEYTFNDIVYKNAIVKELIIFNCNTKRIKNISLVAYQSDSTIIASRSDNDGKWEDIVPETIGESELFKVCKMLSKH